MQGVLVVSFGSAGLLAPGDAIGSLERAIADRVAPVPVFRAFTSSRAIAQLKAREGIEVQAPVEALKEIIDKGYTHIVVQPLYLIAGQEYDRLVEGVRTVSQASEAQIVLGRPLLYGHGDYQALIEALNPCLPEPSLGTGILWMGHGTRHPGNTSYVYLERLWRAQRQDLHLVNIEAYPQLEDVVPDLQRRGYQQILLYPLLLGVGGHIQRDLDGEENALGTRLRALGFKVESFAQGIGNLVTVQTLFALRVAEMVIMGSDNPRE